MATNSKEKGADVSPPTKRVDSEKKSKELTTDKKNQQQHQDTSKRRVRCVSLPFYFYNLFYSEETKNCNNFFSLPSWPVPCSYETILTANI